MNYKELAVATMGETLTSFGLIGISNSSLYHYHLAHSAAGLGNPKLLQPSEFQQGFTPWGLGSNWTIVLKSST